jgi:DNA-nicking Smr family endonuclease
MGLASVLDRLLAALMRRAPGMGRPIPVLDLHGLGVRDAIKATERFLQESAEAGVPEVRIVYGKGRGSPSGRGVLCEVIPRWLCEAGHPWVALATPLPDATGADGAMRVLVRRPR